MPTPDKPQAEDTSLAGLSGTDAPAVDTAKHADMTEDESAGSESEHAEYESQAAAPRDVVSLALAAPWRIHEFRTPALPGVVLTQTPQEFSRATAKILHDEAVRCGFTVSKSDDLSDTSEGDAE